MQKEAENKVKTTRAKRTKRTSSLINGMLQKESFRDVLHTDVCDIYGMKNMPNENKYTDSFYSSVMNKTDIFKDKELSEYAQMAFDRDMRICYMNPLAQVLLPNAQCEKEIEKYAQIEGLNNLTNEKFPFQTSLRCENGIFMCIISNILIERKDYYIVSVAFTNSRAERGMYAFLCAKLAVLNLKELTMRRISGKRRSDEQVQYISDKFESQAKKTEILQTLLSSQAIIETKSEVATAKEYFSRIAKCYCDSVRFKNRELLNCECNIEDSFIIDYEDDVYISVTPIFAMATVYLTDAMYSISNTGYVTFGVIKDGLDDILTFKTNVGRRVRTTVMSLSEDLTDKGESDFYKMFFKNIIAQYAQAPDIDLHRDELTVKLYLPKKSGHYILRSNTSTKYRFAYLPLLFASLGLYSFDSLWEK